MSRAAGPKGLPLPAPYSVCLTVASVLTSPPVRIALWCLTPPLYLLMSMIPFSASLRQTDWTDGIFCPVTTGKQIFKPLGASRVSRTDAPRHIVDSCSRDVTQQLLFKDLAKTGEKFQNANRITTGNMKCFVFLNIVSLFVSHCFIMPRYPSSVSFKRIF